MDSISAIPQQPQLGRLAQFLRYLETQSPEFLPKQLDVMGLVRQLALPQASTVENLSYGNLPFTMPPEGTGAMIPQVKTGRKAEVADLVSMLSGVPGGKAVADVGTKISNEAADALVRMITRNPQATAPGVIQETAMPMMQAVAPKMPGLLAPRSELGFYSALEEAVGPLQNKGTGTQFLAQLEKTPGVKPEEIKWTGLDDFLKSRQNVTKAEVQDYLAQNRVNLQEVRLGEMSPENLALRDSALNRYREITDSIADTRLKAEQGLLSTEEAMGILRPLMAERGNLDRTINLANTSVNTKFSKYTLPGGENYREILLTLPQKPVTPIAGGKSVATEVFERTMMDKYSGETFSSVYNRLSPNEIDKYEMLVREDRNAAKTESILQDKRTNFRSSHYPDQPNILAHMRVNDRVVDGKKTLFIEEVQSDWHQAGRKKGYQQNLSQDDVKNLLANEGYDVNYNGINWVVSSKTGGVVPNKLAGGESNYQFAGNLNQVAAMVLGRRDLMPNTGSGIGPVPDAPFKTTWHELTLKRAIQEAAEKGYDKIAFTTGKTQAERYDLSKQVDEINVTARTSQISGEQIRTVALDTIDGQSIRLAVQSNGIVGDVSSPSARNFVGQNLSEIVGKELAEKIMKEGSQTISGEGLRVGGKGMEGFYDQILPKSLEKLGKKFDAKVGKTDMDGVEVWSMDITPKMRESVLTKGQPLFQAAPLIPAAGLLGDEGE